MSPSGRQHVSPCFLLLMVLSLCYPSTLQKPPILHQKLKSLFQMSSCLLLDVTSFKSMRMTLLVLPRKFQLPNISPEPSSNKIMVPRERSLPSSLVHSSLYTTQPSRPLIAKRLNHATLGPWSPFNTHATTLTSLQNSMAQFPSFLILASISYPITHVLLPKSQSQPLSSPWISLLMITGRQLAVTK